MRRFAVCVAMVVAVLMMSNAAMAFNFADHVKVGTNAKGDTLIFPFYAALNGGWETKFWVINTATDRSVVAKVVVRSQKYTQELLDFLIYLSPTDVWTGTIRYNNGRVEYFSDDDSAVSSAGGGSVVWANTAPVTQPLSLPRCNDTANIGYVEVFETSHSYQGSTFSPAQGSAAVSLNVPPTNKNAIYRAHADLVANGTSINAGLVLDGINVMTGIMEFRNNSLNQKAAMQATALRDYGASLGNGRGSVALNVQNVTAFGELNAFNAIGEVEAALAKNDLAMYYSDRNLTFHLLTFPTKLSQLPAACTPVASQSPYFSQRPMDTLGCINYQATHYDVSENAASSSAIFSPAQQGTLCDEVTLLPYPQSFAFSQGWARYVLPSGTAFNMKDPLILGNAVNPINAALNTYDGMFTGAPMLGTVLNLGSVNDGYTLSAAAYTDGLVTSYSAAGGLVAGGPINYYYYQSQDERNTGTVSANNGVIGGVSHDGYDANRPALFEAPIPNENETRAATAAQQGNDVSQPPVAADTFHPVQSFAPDQQ